MLAEQRFHTGIVDLNYGEGEASGPPLVLLHGGSLRWQSFLPLIPDLSQHWHVYSPDLRGHGLSGRVAGSYRLRDYAADIASFLQHVVKEPAIVFGHSLGGHVAILLAARHPRLVKGLVIGDAPFHRTKLRAQILRDQQRLLYWKDLAGPSHAVEDISERLKQTPIAVGGKAGTVVAGELFGEGHPWFRDMAECLHLLDPDMLSAVIEFDEMHEGYDYEHLFPLISCPVLIIQGSPPRGGMLSNEEIEHALTLLPTRATVARMATVGHSIPTHEEKSVL